MKTSVLLLLFCHVSSPVRHSFRFFYTASSGVPNIPEFVATLRIDDIQAFYCDNNKKAEVKQEAWRKLLEDNPKLLMFYTEECFEIQPKFSRARLHSLMKHFNHTGGVLQVMWGCDWDEDTGQVAGFLQYGYDGEDFISLDVKNLKWIALKPEAAIVKQEWDADKNRTTNNVKFITEVYPQWLKMYLNYGNISLLRTDLPSVSLLQKTPSSPVSCHATGFYPDRAEMFWRKDGEQLHEDVDRGEILHNHDGTFQMRVDLNVSFVKPEDWRRYDCVIQLSGLKEDIIINLDRSVIRTNRVPPSEFPAGFVAGVVVGLLLLAVCIAGLFVWRKRKSEGERCFHSA